MERRLRSWKEGELETLLIEGRTIQHRLRRHKKTKPEANLASTFAHLMFRGKTQAAFDLLATKDRGGVLDLDHIMKSEGSNDQTVKDILKSKHPKGQPATPDTIIEGTPSKIHPILFEGTDAHLICSTALKTKGSAGLSGLDAYFLAKNVYCFKATSTSLCQSLADVAKHLCSFLVDPESVSPLLACRLVALDKCPGVCPIGIGDTSLAPLPRQFW